MTNRFQMNGRFWNVVFVSPNDDRLVDRTGKLTVATTDASTSTIWLSDALRGDFLMTVFIHELSHATIISYNLTDDIHRMVYRDYWVEAEEFICNFIADYGFKIFKIAFDIFGYDAWQLIPKEFDNYFSKGGVYYA